MRNFQVFLSAIAILLSACTAESGAADAVIDRFLAARDVEREQAAAQDRALADVDGRDGADIVLVWRILGPTYSSNMLTVFPAEGAGYAASISAPLEGQASLTKVENGIIVIDQLTLDDGDPICCPTLRKQTRYKLSDGKLVPAAP